MVYLLDAHFGRDGREESEALLQRRSGDSRQAAHPRRLQRADAGLAVVLHVQLLHRPRRQVPARQPRRERLRSALPHLPLHAHRGSPPHVRGRGGRGARRAADLRADARAQDRRRAHARRHRPGHHPEYLNFHCSVSLDLFGSEVSTNAANFYTAGLKGRFEETKKTRRSPPQGRDLPGDRGSDGDAHRHARGAGADLAERAAARRLRGRLPARRRPLERGHQEPRHRRRAHAAPPRLPPRHRQLRARCGCRPTAAS